MPRLIALMMMLIPLSCIGADSSDILLGQVISVSSPLVGDISGELKSGYEAYFAELNERGGIHGRKVRLVQRDDGYNASRTLSLTKELLESERIVALVGYLGTPGLEALVNGRVLVDHRIAMVGPSTGVARLLSERNVFPIRASYEAELVEIVAHAKTMQLRTIAFIAWNAGAGSILRKAFPEIVAAGGLRLSYQASFDPSSDPALLQKALSDSISPLQNSRADAVVFVAGGSALYEGIRQLRSKLGSAIPIYTISSVNWEDLVKKLGPERVQGIVISQAVPYPYSPRLAIVKAYLNQMRRAGKDPNYYSLEGYLGAGVVAEALRRAAPNITRSNVTEALNNLGHYDAGGFEISYSAERRQGFRKPETTLITSQGMLLR